MIEALFWIFVGIVIYVYFGYPLLLIIIAQFRRKPVKKGNITPFASIRKTLRTKGVSPWVST